MLSLHPINKLLRWFYKDWTRFWPALGFPMQLCEWELHEMCYGSFPDILAKCLQRRMVSQEGAGKMEYT